MKTIVWINCQHLNKKEVGHPSVDNLTEQKETEFCGSIIKFLDMLTTHIGAQVPGRDDSLYSI